MKAFMGLLTSVYCIPWILLIFMLYRSVCTRLWKAVASGGVVEELCKITVDYEMVCFLMASGVAWINNFSDVTRMLNVLPAMEKYGNGIVFAIVIIGAGCNRIIQIIMKEKQDISLKEILLCMGKIVLWSTVMFAIRQIGNSFGHLLFLGQSDLYSILLTGSYETFADYRALVIGFAMPVYFLFMAYEIPKLGLEEELNL